jgi:hypothetical protein
MERNNKPINPQPAATGNASNPSPEDQIKPVTDQLLNEKAENYLREGGNIEDIPDAEEDWDNK